MRYSDVTTRSRPRRRLRPMTLAALAGMLLAAIINTSPAAAAPAAATVALQPAAVQPAAVQPAAVQPAAVQPVYADFDGGSIPPQEIYIADELVLILVLFGAAATVAVILKVARPSFVGVRPFGRYGPEL